MVKLKTLNQKIVSIVIVSVVVSMLLAGVLIDRLVKNFYTQEAKSNLTNSIMLLKEKLDQRELRLRESVENFSAHIDIITSMNLIDGYQDKENYEPLIFDVEKVSLNETLKDISLSMEHNVVALYDSSGGLASFFVNSSREGYSGYVSFKDSNQSIYVNKAGEYIKSSDTEEEIIAPSTHCPTKNLTIPSFYNIIRGKLSLVVHEPITRRLPDGSSRVIGYVKMMQYIEPEFFAPIAKRNNIGIGLYINNRHAMGFDIKMLEPLRDINSTPLAQKRAGDIEMESEDFFISTSHLLTHRDDVAKFIFSYDKKRLKDEFFRAEMILVGIFLVVTFIVSILTYFVVRRTISRPLAHLTHSAEQLSLGKSHKLLESESDDELGKLAVTFNAMSKEILTRERELRELNRTLEVRIEEEVNRSRKKDMLIQEHSKISAMADLMVNISHHWRQPLNNIGIMLQNVEEMVEMGEMDQKMMHEIVNKSMDELSFMSRTIDDFSELFKPNEKKSRFLLEKVVANSVAILSKDFRLKNITVETEIPKSYEVQGYPSQLKQVVLNILLNAKEAILREREQNSMLEGGITIRCFKEEEMAVLEIVDNGTGIKKEHLGRIFEPYFTTKFRSQGVGNSLYTAKVLIENNNEGAITAHNRAEGRGAVFVIKLPLLHAY